MEAGPRKISLKRYRPHRETLRDDNIYRSPGKRVGNIARITGVAPCHPEGEINGPACLLATRYSPSNRPVPEYHVCQTPLAVASNLLPTGEFKIE